MWAILLCAWVAAANQSLLQFQSAQYLGARTDFFRSTARSDNQSLNLILNERRTWRDRYTGRVSLRNEYSESERANYFNVHELYISTRVQNIEASFGRKLETWSYWEDDWKQALLNSRYIQNRLQPEMAGLTGLFLTSHGEYSRVTLALLPMHIPEFGPRFFIRDGVLVSPNPWFNPPSNEYDFNGQRDRIRYTLNRPTTLQAISYPGAALKIEGKLGTTNVRAMYAFKPIAQLLLGFPSWRRVRLTDTNAEMYVEIQARQLYHQVSGLDAQHRLGPWTLQASALYERPLRNEIPEGWTAQNTEPSWIYAASASRPLEEEGPMAARVKVGVMKIIGGDAADRGEFATQTSLFERRFQYLEAYQLQLSKPWRGLWSRPLETSLGVIYDSAQNGGVFSLGSHAEVLPNLRLDASLELLGLVGSNARITDGFIGNYRANDRVSMGMSYVF